MSTWRVALTGSKRDLEQATSISQPPDWNIYQLNGQYILEAAAFSSLADAELVRHHAHEHILPVINGIARLRFGRMQSKRIMVGNQVYHDAPTTRTGFIIVEQSASISVSETATVATIGGPSTTPTPVPPNIVEVGTAFLLDPLVQSALHFFSYEDEWAVNLYRAFEIVSDDMGGKDKLIRLGWTTATELDNFRSVHDPNVTGRMARHGAHSRSSPQAPMNEDEARAFVQRLLEMWLRGKHRQLPSPAQTS